MTVQGIYEAFQRAASAGALTGNDPGGLGDLLASLGATRLAVTDGAPGFDATSAWLTGGTTYLGGSWTLRVTGTPVAGTDRAALVLDLALVAAATPWTFGKAFGALRQSRRPPPGTGGGLILGPSVVAPLVLHSPSIVATNEPGVLPRLQGSLPLLGDAGAPGSDILEGYAGYLGETLVVDGTFDVRGTDPILDLPAVSPGAQLALGALQVAAVGIRLTTTFPDPTPLPEPDAPRSAALLFAEVVLPTVPPGRVTISGPLLFGDYVWPVQVMFAEALTLEGGIQALLAMAGVSDADAFALPPGIAPINMFGLSDLGFGVKPVESGVPGLSYVSIGIASTEPWNPPIPYLTIDKVGTRWAFFFRETRSPLVVGTVFGTMRFGQKTGSSLGAMAPHVRRVERGLAPRTGFDDIVVTVQLALPELAFSAYTEQPFDLPIEEAFRVFFGPGVPELGLRVQSLSVYSSLRRKDFEAGLTVVGDLAYTAGKVTLALTELQLQVQVSQSTVSGLIQGKAEIGVPEAAPIELLARAAYPGTGAWDFVAILRGAVDLPRLVYGLMGEDPPQWVKDVAIELADMELRYNTGAGNPYSASGTLKVKLSENLVGIDMKLEVTVRIERALRTPTTEPLAVALRETSLVEPATVLTGSLSGSFTVGRFVVAASVSVTDAGKDYTFAVTYRDVSLKAATSWVPEGNGKPRHQAVTIRLTGTLGDVVTYLVSLANPNATFRLDPPWDFLNSIDLSGLALVVDPTLQTVAVTYDVKLNLGFVSIDTVGLRYDRSAGTPKVEFVLVAKMLGDTQAKPVAWDAVNQSPPAVPGLGQRLLDLRYLGLGQHVSPKGLTEYKDITAVVDALVAAMRPVSPGTGKPPIDPAKMEFDPSSQWLFGIDAKLMDTVSLKLVFHDPDLYGILVALSGPSASSLAGLSIELLYKKVTDDIGVFHARLQIPDAFRQLQFGAVSVTLGIVTVDIYTNGNFRVDLGFPHNRDWSVSFALEAGIFNGRGGIYFGVLNGATSSRVPRVTNGTFSPVIELGIGLSVGVGRTFEKGPLKAGLYVNLVVVFEGALAWFHPDDGNAGTEMYYWCRGTAGIVGKIYGSVDFKVISVDVSIEISAMATLELTAYKATLVELNLSVRASASIKIVFFRVSFSFSLTLRTSFVIGSDSPAPWQEVPGMTMRRRLATAAALGEPPQEYRLRFDKDAKVFPDGEPRTAYLSLVPAYTIAGVPVNWSGDGTVPPNDDPAYRLVVMLVTDNAIPADATTIAATHRVDVSRNALAETAADTSFNQLTEALLRWSLDALGVTDPTATVTLVELTELVAQLALDEAATAGFTWENIEGFFARNLHVVVSGTPAGPEGDEVSRTPFPMLPPLRWTSPDLPDPGQRERDFGTYQPIDATYEAEALAYFAKLDPRPRDHRPSPEARLAAAGDVTESMATFVLRDYARLVARAAAQAAADLLTAFPHDVVATDSLAGIGETYGVDPEAVALANPDWPVVAGKTVHLGTLPVQVSATDTLASIAAAYSADLPSWLTALDTTTPLLRAGATVPLPGFRHAGLSVDDTAAVFWVRLGRTLPEDVPLADWYAAAIDRLNAEETLPASLVVPTGYQQTTTTTWTRLPGDTVADVAAYLALSQNVVAGTPYAAWLDAVRAANPTPGTDVALPAGAAATVLPNDTLATLRARLLLGKAAFDAYVAPAGVLVPLVTVPVPGATATTGENLTLLTLGQAYGLGLEDLAGRMAADPGVLATWDRPLTVPDVPAMPLAGLMTALHGGRPMATVSGQVARFMLNGLRLPAPELVDGRYHATGDMTGAYDLLGQQVTGPAPAPVPPAGGDPEPAVVTITVDKARAADWLTFAAAEVRDSLLTVAGAADDAVVRITEADLAHYPATGLAPVVLAPLAPLALSHDVGVRYGVPHVIPWQTTDGPVLPVPPPPGVAPSLWPLPDDLRARAAGGVSASSFLLEQTTPQTGADATATEVGSYAWGTLVAFGARRIPGLPGTVEVLGADTADRQRLALVLEYLRAVPERAAIAAFPPPPEGETVHLRLLWRLPPTPGMTPGLTSIPLVPEGTFLVQTNLSTETRSALTTTADPTWGKHFASIADAERFLTLLWECSVVGGGGYWMRVQGAGADVPESIFDQDGLASFSLLIQLGSQSSGTPDRHLYAFGNVAVVGSGVDPASVALTARGDPAERRPVASVDPGQVGFAAEYANPGDDDTPQGLLRRLYGLLGFSLTPSLAFDGSEEGRPVAPQPPNGHDDLGLVVHAEEDETVWRISRVVDASRFARVHLPELPTAPSPLADPYAGVRVAAATGVAVWFQDVFGNVSGTPATEPIPVRYTDPLLGPGSWPSTTTSYTVSPAGTEAEVRVAVDLQTVAYQPGASDPGSAAAAAAARDRQRFAAAYYQVMRDGLSASVLTSLQQAPGAEPAPLPVGVETLRRYVIGAHALLGSLATIGDARATAGTLDEVVASYGVDSDTLAAANVTAVLRALLDATSLAVPVSAAFRNGDTVRRLCESVSPPPDPAVVLTDEDNVVLPLMPGTEVVTPARDVVVGTDEPTAHDLADTARCTLATLVAANESRQSLLTPGFVFEVNGVQVGVAPDGPGSDTTLKLVAQTFGATYTAAQVAALNAEKPGMFRAGATLIADGYVVAHGDTLERNEAGLTPAQLAAINADTADLFPPGTPLFLTTRATDVPAEETLGEFAAAQGTTPGALLRHNGSVAVSATAPPVVPGLWAWPADPRDVVVPYTVGTGDTLADVARHFDGATARSLVAANAAMPGTVAADVTITVDTHEVTTSAPSSFADVCALFTPAVSPDALADAIAARTGVLAAGALLACPRGVLTTTATPGDAARPYGVPPVAFLAANAGTPGLLVAGQALHAWPSTPASPAPFETIVANDTLTAVVERFRRRDVTTSIETLVTANATVGFLRAGTAVLVPPVTATLVARVGAAGWTFPSTVFPLRVTLELARDEDLVDPALVATAMRDRTAVPAARPAGDRGERSLASFAAAVEKAVPVLRVATGQVLDADTDVWAVVFGDAGIAKVAVTPPLTIEGTAQPRTFAIRPLSTTLIARNEVFTQAFDVATGTLTGGEKRNYQGIDLDVWARGFLADVELVLSAAYARGAYSLNRPALDAIVEAKKTLAGAVAHGLDDVLDGFPAPAAKRAAAVETLRQQLLVSLTRGYDTSAVVQYDTDVASPWESTYARLAGNPVVTFGDSDVRNATVSNGKVSLTKGTSQVSLLVNVPDVRAHAGLDLTLDFSVVELEFGIAPEIDGYERSDWLTFVSPIGSGSPAQLDLDLGSPRVPLPLRAYPPMPLLVGHDAVVPTEPTVLDEALRWRYEFALQHQSAEQDSVEFRVTYNRAGSAVANALTDDDLFATLAHYSAVSTPLLGLLAGVVDGERASEAQRAVLTAALGTYESLVTKVANAWTAHWKAPESDDVTPAAKGVATGPALDVYQYALGLRAADGWYTTLRLGRQTVSGPGGVGWPDIVCVTPGGDEHPLDVVPPELCDCADAERCRCYTFPQGKVPAFTLLTFRFTFPPVHVASYQNASSTTWVTRNARLLGETWPGTTSDFVYRTPEVGYPKPVVPFIDVTGAIPIAAWPDAPLQAMFDAVFDGSSAGRTVAVGVRYGYTLVPGDPPVEALLPVAQSTVAAYDAATIAAITEKLTFWLRDVDPAREGGAWAFWVSLYSSLDPSLQRPVLQLKRLSSPLVRPPD